VSWFLWAIAGSICGTVLGTYVKFRRRKLEGKNPQWKGDR
jgi:hypothetical protein